MIDCDKDTMAEVMEDIVEANEAHKRRMACLSAEDIEDLSKEKPLGWNPDQVEGDI